MHNGRALAVGFDGSFDGFLTIIFKRYYEKLYPDYIGEETGFAQILDTAYIYVDADQEKAIRVFNGLKKKSIQAAENLYTAFLHSGPGRYMDLFNYTVLAFSKGNFVDNYESIGYVLNVHKMAQAVGREAHLYTGFLRFAQTKTGVLYAEFSPVNRVLPIVCEHFKSRLIDEKWIIEDKHYHQAAIYDGNDLLIADIGVLGASFEAVEEEDEYQRLWAQFVDTIAVEDRISDKRRLGMLPKRYRKYTTEFSRRP